MDRQLFLHHSFPVLYFAIRLQIATTLMIMAFSKCSALAYGGPWAKTKCSNAQWVKTWDFA
ncbi:hypothetical protein M405DRAFT_820572, partial [Rhizopogon salebrosus TDB-379]